MAVHLGHDASLSFEGPNGEVFGPFEIADAHGLVESDGEIILPDAEVSFTLVIPPTKENLCNLAVMAEKDGRWN